MKKFILLLILALSNSANAASQVKLLNANIDSHDLESLQDGAKTYMDYCSGCHSLKYMRFNRIAKDLELTEDEVRADLMHVATKMTDFVTTNITEDNGNNWFGKQPPDLSLIGRSRGKDWLYTYLLSFYVDGNKATGSNNLVFKDVGMPNVLEGLQGQQRLVDGQLQIVEGSGTLDKQNFDKKVINLVNFLDYVGEPIKNYRQSLGHYVILFLLVLLILAYLLKKEYWKDIHK